MNFFAIVTVFLAFATVLSKPVFLPGSFNATNGRVIAEVQSSPLAHSFGSKEEMLRLPFWKNIVKQRNPAVAKSTVIYIRDTNTTLFFQDSELEASAQSFPFFGKKSRDVEMTEVAWGLSEEKVVEGVPISRCVSSKFSSGGGSYSHSYTWKRLLSVTVSPKVSLSLVALGATLSGSLGSLGLSFSSTGSISCSAPAGGKVQVFTTIRYRTFPFAKKRRVTYSGHDVETGEWVSFEDGDEEYRRFGPVFFDLSSVPNHHCVSKPEYLRCDELNRILDLDGDSDPRAGLLM